jgi:transcription elongation GreA/GreB family factor
MNTLELLDGVVTIGSTVVVRDLETNEVDIYTLVPPNRADISLNRISSLTPVAHALYGRRPGETVEVLAPAGAVYLRIVSIHREAEYGEYG